MKSSTLPFLLGLTSLANLATARTDLEGCVSSEIVVDYYASYLWYVPDTGEICSFLDCGGGRAPPKTDKPGCGGYHGTATVTPDYIEGWGPNGKQAASTTTVDATTSATAVAAMTTSASQSEESDSSSSGSSNASSVSGSQTPSITAAPSSSTAASMTTTASSGSAANSTSAAASSTPTGNAAVMPASNVLGVVALMGAMVGAMAL
ncbi:hypothetical protein PENANT_c021G05161 [Penicillium antarcticum]|uniref:Siderophore biosynthesis enzyme n=1 Tax=Penicillium antarcticum TaxID=416450 RepID=A0A1V6PZP7_9EURO|nr:uncharacterized protein N7508_010919 [Penicillium antarcticum]KAJ5296098.1 hypothetical protein N7508_010919 [Penicillium antarcticum]OQD82488.1 hypothetical protein PENANT_c021G05161 [Penicillium antarcticum]